MHYCWSTSIHLTYRWSDMRNVAEVFQISDCCGLISFLNSSAQVECIMKKNLSNILIKQK